jgi:DNA invertase Pin-like site-specific DNA recombinase
MTAERMTADRSKRRRCAVYTRKSSEEGLEQAFNSLDAQREACEAYIKSQAGEGWHLIRTGYDDGGVSGGTLDRSALRQLLADIRARKVDTVVVYKVDRLTRSLADFAKIVEVFDARGVSFVSVTQQFNTTTSMGRLTLNMLLSFAQFEREVTGERIRDKIAASKQKGMWMGGYVPLGYEAKDRTLVINKAEAETVRTVFGLYREHGNVRQVKDEADRLGLTTKIRRTEDGRMRGGRPLSRGHIYHLLGNSLYAGRIAHKGTTYEGLHEAIIDAKTWEAVHAKLAGNVRERRSGSRAAEPSLLAGLLHDEYGNRFSPSHALNKGVRYRYYVSQAVIQHRAGEAGSIVRVPAREIEDVISAQIVAFLKDPGRVLDELGSTLSPGDQQRLIIAATKQAERWPQISHSERRTFMLRVVASIAVTDHEIRIALRRNGLRQALQSDETSIDMVGAPGSQAEALAIGDEFILRVPTRLKLCSGEMRLVIPPGNVRELRPRPNATLIKALARAHAWKEKLFSGHAPSIQTIAKAEGVTPRYVGRIIRLAFLAPDIVEAILEGYQPADLELERLMKGIPIGWQEQRRVLGLSRG